MEWFADDPHRGQIILTLVVLAIAALAVWRGRRRLAVSIPFALGFLIFADLAIQGVVPARSAAQRSACIANLRMIQKAKVDWASESSAPAGAIPTKYDLYGTNRVLRDWPACPRGGIYTIGAANQNPTCSFSSKGHRLE